MSLASPLAPSDVEKLLGFLEQARSLAVPPISNFFVGAALLGASGRIYPGFNVEFLNQALHHTVHAEQCALSLAQTHGETGVRALAITAAPCGHCRQFLNELADGSSLTVLIGAERLTLGELLPRSFGPRDLKIDYGILSSPPWSVDLGLDQVGPDPVVAAALQAARRSYAPYSGCAAGVALQTLDGRIFQGCYAENAAFNPSFPPMQAALCHLLSEGGSYADLRRAVLVQRPCATSLEPSTRGLLTGLAPQATFEAHLVH